MLEVMTMRKQQSVGAAISVMSHGTAKELMVLSSCRLMRLQRSLTAWWLRPSSTLAGLVRTASWQPHARRCLIASLQLCCTLTGPNSRSTCFGISLSRCGLLINPLDNSFVLHNNTYTCATGSSVLICWTKLFWADAAGTIYRLVGCHVFRNPAKVCLSIPFAGRDAVSWRKGLDWAIAFHHPPWSEVMWGCQVVERTISQQQVAVKSCKRPQQKVFLYLVGYGEKQ